MKGLEEIQERMPGPSSSLSSAVVVVGGASVGTVGGGRDPVVSNPGSTGSIVATLQHPHVIPQPLGKVVRLKGNGLTGADFGGAGVGGVGSLGTEGGAGAEVGGGGAAVEEGGGGAFPGSGGGGAKAEGGGGGPEPMAKGLAPPLVAMAGRALGGGRPGTHLHQGSRLRAGRGGTGGRRGLGRCVGCGLRRVDELEGCLLTGRHHRTAGEEARSGWRLEGRRPRELGCHICEHLPSPPRRLALV